MFIDSIKKVYEKPSYLILSALIAIAVFIFAVLLPNFSLIINLLGLESASLFQKLKVIFSLFGSIKTNFTVISASYTILIAILFGVNVSMLIYYIKSRKGTIKIKGSGTGTSLGGLISGIFGIGCAACGTFILSAILGLFGATGIISFLPLGGEEFGIIGVLILVYAIYATAKKIQAPNVCSS